ncbi:unnamed protein product [Effrenium voratum]|nr:unnamed protein product [Effrenium voratum]
MHCQPSSLELDWVKDIFGDTSVLRPLGDPGIAEEEEDAPPAVHASLAVAEAQLKRSREEVKEESESLALPLADSLDPDVLEKSYQLVSDQAFAKSHQPERWLQAYCKDPTVDARTWTDEEYQNEARWIYNQVFRARGYVRDATESAIIRILSLLHDKKFELAYIAEFWWWMVAKILDKEDLWKIQEYDLMWQSLWTRYLLLLDWVQRLDRANIAVPHYIKSKTTREVWNHVDLEQQQRDAHDWLLAMHPTSEPESRSTSSVDALMKMARRSRFDEKLGIKESIEMMSLQAFGITPSDLGDNLAADKQLVGPLEDVDNQASCEDVCERHIDPNFPTGEAVKAGVTTFLMRLIAAEPRVRAFVRKEFWKICTISAKVTEAGRALAKEAAHSFKQSYRAFHVTYRPVGMFGVTSDLFLEMQQLQRKGFINIEYSLINGVDRDGKTKVVIPCHSVQDIIRTKQRLTAHFPKRANPHQSMPSDAESISHWNRCEELIPKLEAAARLREAGIRRAGAGGDTKAKVTASFAAATMNLDADALTQFMVADPIFEKLSQMYCVSMIESHELNTFAVIESDWNKVRRTILRRVLQEELYPMVWAEVQDYLTKMSSQVVCQAVRERLTRMVDVQPVVETDVKLDEAEEKVRHMRQEQDDDTDMRRKREDPAWLQERRARKKGLCSILVVLPEVGETCIVGFVNAFGDAIDLRQLFKRCLRQPLPVQSVKGSYEYDREMIVLQHRETFKQMLCNYKPAVVLLAVTDSDILRMKVNVEDLIAKDQTVLAHFKVLPRVHFVDTTVPRAIAYNKRLMESPAYRDYAIPSHRIAISCTRLHQDALAEACQLWHELPDENGFLKLTLHALQQDVPKDMLSRTITRTLQEVTAKSGLQINKVRRSTHQASVIQFVPGLGPRKAKVFMKALADSVKSRDTVIEILAKHLSIKDPMTNPVMKNVLPFLKIEPDFRDPWGPEESPSLDRLRIPRHLQNWVQALCKEALSAQAENLFGSDEEDSAEDAVGRVMRLLQRDASFQGVIQDRDWSNWPAMAGEPQYPDSANLDTLFEMIVQELQEPYKDLRQIHSELSSSELFYLALTESAEEFKSGCIVRGTVQRDEEYPDKDQEKEDDDRGHYVPKVMVRLASGTSVLGSFQKAYSHGKYGKAGHLPGCDRHFTRGEAILARVREVKAGNYSFRVLLSVDQDEEIWMESLPIKDEDVPYFLPGSGDDWTKVKLGLLDNSEQKRKAQLKDWIRRPRNIKHPNYVVGDHAYAVNTLQHFFLGTVLFRSSKNHDLLIAYLKVRPTTAQELTMPGELAPDKFFRTFDVFERLPQKTYGCGFEVANELEVEGQVYRDFDEIIARHMDPIMENLRLLQEHKRFGLQNGQIQDRKQVMQCMQSFSRDNLLLHYHFLLHDRAIGHGSLLWCCQGRNVKEELIQVTPRGYSLWGQPFTTLKALIEWFKTVGMSNASKCRRDFKEEHRKRQLELKDKRGDHADPEARYKRHRGFATTATTTQGLQTPGGRNTPTMYQAEANAPTPAGLSPGVAPTPRGSPAAGTPAAAFQRSPAPQTPMAAFGAAPQTPAAAFPRGAAPRSGFAPQTPAAIWAPRDRGTPNGHGGITPGGMVPQTPAGAYRSGTPSGMVPQTPIAAFSRQGTPGGMVPQTPTAAFAPSRGGGTPGMVPQTPLAGSRAGGGTPSNMVPQTPPNAAFARAGGTPVPQTPAAAFDVKPDAGGATPAERG